MKNKFYFTLVLAALMCFAGWTAYAKLNENTPAAQTWEYLTLKDPENAQLNQLGAAGWELVDVSPLCAGDPHRPTCTFWAYMKRARHNP